MAEDDKPAVKAKLPAAKNIRSPEFKPHGLGGDSRTRGPRPSGLTAAQAKKRKLATIAGVTVVGLGVVAATGWYVTRPDPTVEVAGKFNAEPKVTIPKDALPGKTLKVTTPIKGNGKAIANGDMVYAKHVFYKWSKGEGDNAKSSTSKKVGDTYSGQAAQQGVQPLPAGKIGIKGLDKGLIGQTVGSRVVLEIPPADGFGDNGAQYEIGKNDSLVFVFDILADVPKDAGPQGTEKKLDDPKLPKVEKAAKAGAAPKVTIPKEDAPKDLQIKPLVEGNGEAIQKGDTAIVQYQGQLWRNGKTFDSSWEKGGTPAAFPVGTGGTVPGFDKGLTGQKVGSRVMLVLPPKEGYGKNGQPQAGIKGDDTLVFIVDIVGRLPK